MDAETFRWLLTENGRTLLGAAGRAWEEAAGDPLRAAAVLARLGPAGGTPDRRAAALTQARLRERAVAKFGDDAARLYFTPGGLEQATRAPVAAQRAARLAGALGPARPVVDLGCGIGGDLVALARAGLAVTGVDSDPVTAAVAEANLRAAGLPGSVVVADACGVDRTRFAAAYADPARRTGRGRTFTPDDWVPPWSFVERLLTGTAVVKTAPGLPHGRVPAGVEAEWVSEGGDLVECVLWSPALATAERRATVIRAGRVDRLTDRDDPHRGGPAPAGGVGEYLYEPDDAVVRAGLVTAVAALVGGWLPDPHLAYVSADRWSPTPFARGYRVLERLPYREKRLRAALRDRDVGGLTIKRRGVAVVPEQLRRRLALAGSTEATLVLTRAGGSGTALLVAPVDP